MHRVADRTALLLLAALGATGVAWPLATTGCEGTTQAGSPVDTSSAPGGAGGDGATGGGPCNAPAHGFCDTVDDCRCTMCELAAVCTPFGCLADGWCTLPFEDSCTCSDCDLDARCLFLDGSNCVSDGTCEPSSEGCSCPDCQLLEGCLDNAQLCEGGAPDGACDPALESCHCLDCLDSEACLCDPEDCYSSACVCPICWGDEYCDETWCWDDGLCDWIWEGCGCQDCASTDLCAGYTGAGNAGGMGGMAAAGGAAGVGAAG